MSQCNYFFFSFSVGNSINSKILLFWELVNVQSTLVKCTRIYIGQYTFPILLLNNDNMLGEHKGREKDIVYGRLFLANPHFVL